MRIVIPASAPSPLVAYTNAAEQLKGCAAFADGAGTALGAQAVTISNTAGNIVASAASARECIGFAIHNHTAAAVDITVANQGWNIIKKSVPAGASLVFGRDRGFEVVTY